MTKTGPKGSKQGKRRSRRDAPAAAAPLLVSMERTRRAYLAGVGLVAAFAFGSLWSQFDGLLGPQGILPVGDWYAAVDALLARKGVDVTPATWSGWGSLLGERMRVAPTLGWLLPTDRGGPLLCALGMVASVFLIAGRYPAPALLVVWASYLSLSTMGQVFLSFQWDTLLTEVAFASLLVAWWGARPRYQAWAPGWWVLRFVLFRLVFFGGLVKLQSGDPAWRDLSALTFHYWTQPLPNPLSWSMTQLPWLVHFLSCAVMFFVELVLVFAVFGRARERRAAALGIALLMGALAATGNYGFFQLLTVVLCLPLLDDRLLTRLDGVWPPGAYVPDLPTPGKVAVGVGAACLALLGVLGAVPRYTPYNLPDRAEQVLDAAAPFRTVNQYGLFAVMTKVRPIPVLEARWPDGDWEEITWRWQSSDPAARPAQVAPHMPRLDWQLWFAGLQGCDRAPWVRKLQQRVLEGSEPVANLIGDMRLRTSAPPEAVRTVRYRYTPTTSEQADLWWNRTLEGPFCPEVSW